MKSVLKFVGVLLVLRLVFQLMRGGRRRRWAARQGLGYGGFGQGGRVPVDGRPAGGAHRVVPVD